MQISIKKEIYELSDVIWGKIKLTPNKNYIAVEYTDTNLYRLMDDENNDVYIPVAYADKIQEVAATMEKRVEMKSEIDITKHAKSIFGNILKSAIIVTHVNPEMFEKFKEAYENYKNDSNMIQLIYEASVQINFNNGKKVIIRGSEWLNIENPIE